MSRAQKLINIAEAVLKMAKVDYKKDPHGVTAYDNISNDYAYNNFKKAHHDNQEVHNTLPIHDELSKEAKEQFGQDPDGKKRDAVNEYTHSEYSSMNNHLRHGNSTSDENRLRIGHLKTLTKNKTKNSFAVYRSNSKKIIPETEGEHFKDHGFTSTTLRPSFGVNSFGSEQGSQHFIIHVKRGTKGHYVSAHKFSNGEGYEKEFLLHPGTTFRVGKTKKHANGNTYTHLHIHSQEADSHENDFKLPEPLNIEKDSPDEDHKFIMNHYKNHYGYENQTLQSKHDTLLKKTPEQKKSQVEYIKSDYPHIYGPPLDIEKDSPNDDHKFILNHLKNHVGASNQAIVNKHNYLKSYPGEISYEKKNIMAANPGLYKNENRPVNIEKDSPDEHHKFLLNHFKHHLNMNDSTVKAIHKSLLDSTPDQKKISVDMIKSQNPHLYGAGSHVNTEDTFNSKEWGDAFGHSKEQSPEDEHEANHKIVIANAKKHGFDGEDIKHLSHGFNMAKGKPHLKYYKDMIADAKAGKHPYGEEDD